MSRPVSAMFWCALTGGFVWKSEMALQRRPRPVGFQSIPPTSFSLTNVASGDGFVSTNAIGCGESTTTRPWTCGTDGSL